MNQLTRGAAAAGLLAGVAGSAQTQIFEVIHPDVIAGGFEF